MRVQSAKTHLIKVLEFINAMKTDNTPRLNKTKQQLIELADICNQIVDGIQEITNTDIKSAPIVSDVSVYNNDLCSMFEELKSEIQSLKIAMNCDETEIIRRNPQIVVQDDRSVQKRYTTAQCSEIVSSFKSAIQRNANIDYESDVANQCSAILWRWFHARYLNTYNQCKEFRYSVMDIKEYIYAIVTAFGYYCEKDSIYDFFEMFDKWENLLHTSKKSNHYVVPYEVASIGKNMKSEHSTFTAAVIWHMFTQNGLSEMCCDEEDSAYLSQEVMLERLFTMNPEIEDWFEEYLSRNGVVV